MGVGDWEDGGMDEMGVVMWVSGRAAVPVGVEWVVVDAGRGLGVGVCRRRLGEHLAGCVRWAAVVALGLAQAGAAVGMAAGPVPPGVDLDITTEPEARSSTRGPTAERAAQALRWAQPGEVVLAWGSQAYLQGEFASVTSGFVRLINLA